MPPDLISILGGGDGEFFKSTVNIFQGCVRTL
jgi:hypothetical protein